MSSQESASRSLALPGAESDGTTADDDALVCCTPHRPLHQTRWFEDEQGCTELVTAENFEAHVSACGFAYQTCPFNPTGCPFLRRSEAAAHRAACEYQPLFCNFCSEELPRCLFQQHQESDCRGYPSTCGDCGAQVCRGDLADHVRTSCPRAMLACPYSLYDGGCTGVYPRGELAGHLKDCCEQHLAAVERQHRTDVAVLHTKVAALAQAVASAKTHTVRWTIAHFSAQRRQAYVQSSKFHAAGLSWFLGVWPNGGGGGGGGGEQSGDSGHLAGYLYAAQPPEPGRRLRFEFAIRAVHPSRPQQAIERLFCSEFPLPRGARSTSWGEPRLFSYDQLRDQGYLAEDSLIVELDLLIVSDVFELATD